MHNYAIIGLGQFGQCMLEALHKRGFETLVIDQDETKVQWARDLSTRAVKADALNFALFEELLVGDVDGAIVDMGDEMERSILVTNYLHKLKVPHIVVEAVNAAHAEILEIVGATRIVFPEQEAAQRLAGLLAGHGRLAYFPVADAFSLIEIRVPATWVGKCLTELQLRRSHHANVIALRKQPLPTEGAAWGLVDPERLFQTTDVVLVAGQTDDLEKLTK